MDHSVYHALNNFAYAHTWAADIAKFFAQDVVFILIGAFALLWLIRPARGRLLDEGSRVAIFAGGVSLVIGLLLVQVINHIWARPRPFVALQHFHKLIPHGTDPSFPSDHVTGTAALAFALLLFGRRWMGSVALVVAILIGVARVMVGIHWPTDILGALGVGLIAASLVYLARAPVTRLAEWCSALYGRLLDALGRVVRPSAHRARS